MVVWTTFFSTGWWGCTSRANIIKKSHNFMRKVKTIWKNTKWLWEITSRFLRGRETRKVTGHVGVFCQSLGNRAYTLENYSNFKSEFSFNNGSIVEIHNYFITRGNARFNDLPELINTISNQDFVSLDNFNKLENLFCMRGEGEGRGGEGLQASWIDTVKRKKENYRETIF